MKKIISIAIIFSILLSTLCMAGVSAANDAGVSSSKIAIAEDTYLSLRSGEFSGRGNQSTLLVRSQYATGGTITASQNNYRKALLKVIPENIPAGKEILSVKLFTYGKANNGSDEGWAANPYRYDVYCYALPTATWQQTGTNEICTDDTKPGYVDLTAATQWDSGKEFISHETIGLAGGNQDTWNSFDITDYYKNHTSAFTLILEGRPWSAAGVTGNSQQFTLRSRDSTYGKPYVEVVYADKKVLTPTDDTWVAAVKIPGNFEPEEQTFKASLSVQGTDKKAVIKFPALDEFEYKTVKAVVSENASLENAKGNWLTFNTEGFLRVQNNATAVSSQRMAIYKFEKPAIVPNSAEIVNVTFNALGHLNNEALTTPLSEYDIICKGLNNSNWEYDTINCFGNPGQVNYNTFTTGVTLGSAGKIPGVGTAVKTDTWLSYDVTDFFVNKIMNGNESAVTLGLTSPNIDGEGKSNGFRFYPKLSAADMEIQSETIAQNYTYNPSNYDTEKEAYITITYKEYAKPMDNATLNLYGKIKTTAADKDLNLFPYANNSWKDASFHSYTGVYPAATLYYDAFVTPLNQVIPSGGVIDSQAIDAEGWYSFDITDYINSVDRSNPISFLLQGNADGAEFEISPREDGEHTPYIDFEYENDDYVQLISINENELVGGTKISLGYKVWKYTTGSVTPMVAAVIYDDFGVLQSIGVNTNVTVSQGECKPILASLTVPSEIGGGWTVKVMLWESSSNMKPIADMLIGENVITIAE